MVTEVFTRKYCDPHTVRDEKVEASEVLQFAFDGVIREVDACAECSKEYNSYFEPLVDYSRPVKKKRAKKAESGAEAASADNNTSDAAEDSSE